MKQPVMAQHHKDFFEKGFSLVLKFNRFISRITRYWRVLQRLFRVYFWTDPCAWI